VIPIVPNDCGIVATDWEGLVTEYNGQSYRVPCTYYPGPFADHDMPGKEVRILEAKSIEDWRVNPTDTYGSILLELIGTTDTNGNMLIVEARLLVPLIIKAEKIVRRESVEPFDFYRVRKGGAR
jgi:hypothetical protein